MKLLTLNLKASHNKKEFSCGKDLLDQYLKEQDDVIPATLTYEIFEDQAMLGLKKAKMSRPRVFTFRM